MSFVAILHGSQRGEEVVHQALMLARTHCCAWSGTCAACWCGMPGPCEGGQHLVPPCYFRNQLLGQ